MPCASVHSTTCEPTPTAMQGATNLALLDLSFNHLLRLPELLPLVCLTCLQDLRLNGNLVQELPG